MQGLYHRSTMLLCIGIFLTTFSDNVFALLQKHILPGPRKLLLLSPQHFFIPGGVYYLLSVGTGVASIGKTTDLPLTNAVINRYVANRKNKLLILFGAGLGYQFHSTRPFTIALGAAFYHIEWGRYGGVVHPAFNLNPVFDALNYSYRVSSSLLWAEQYWIFGRKHWKPYLFLGLGITWNNTFDYMEVPVNPNSSAAPLAIPFRTRTQTYFSYGIGIGVKYLFSKYKTGISIGYRYINLGKGQLGTTPLQTTSVRLTTGRLYAHLIVFSLCFK